MKKLLIILCVLFAFMLVFVSCENKESGPKTSYTVKFNLNGGTGSFPTQIVDLDGKITKPTKNI